MRNPPSATAAMVGTRTSSSRRERTRKFFRARLEEVRGGAVPAAGPPVNNASDRPVRVASIGATAVTRLIFLCLDRNGVSTSPLAATASQRVSGGLQRERRDAPLPGRRSASATDVGAANPNVLPAQLH